MKLTPRSIKVILFAAFALIWGGCITQTITTARAADLPLAAASPLTGVAFDDRPLLLPVQRNFQMAMLTAGSELGRSCGRMEAYGWRMSQTEQGRVNQIFNNTVDRLRLMGYSIAPQSLSSVSKDITLFTADHDAKHFVFLWSAGELGLVLNLCETSAPVPSLGHPTSLSPSVQTFAVPAEVVPTRLSAASKHGAKEVGGFSPIGKWVGGYTCAQGYTGGTLEINHLHGQNFDGIFKFYPTIKNPYVPVGSYAVYGQYDNDSRRILINPGKWLQHPANFYNTVIVGGFDPISESFSAYFQGISGCTSFEAKREGDASYATRVTNRDIFSRTHNVKKKHKKATVKKKPVAMDVNTMFPTLSAPPSSAVVPVPVTTATPAPAAKTAPVVVPPPIAIDPTVPVSSNVPASVTATPSASAVPAAPPALPADDKGIVLPGSGK